MFVGKKFTSYLGEYNSKGVVYIGVPMRQFASDKELQERLVNEFALRKEGVVVFLDGVYEFKYESWTSDCIAYFAEKLGISIETEGDAWDVFSDAVGTIMKEEGWDNVVVFQPEVAGEAYGATLFVRKIRS